MDNIKPNIFSEEISIQPRCISGDNIVYPFVELDGTFLPCCWLSTSYEKMLLIEDLYHEDFKNLNLKHNNVNNIIELWDKIRDTWYTDTPFKTCAEVCKKI